MQGCNDHITAYRFAMTLVGQVTSDTLYSLAMTDCMNSTLLLHHISVDFYMHLDVYKSNNIQGAKFGFILISLSKVSYNIEKNKQIQTNKQTNFRTSPNRFWGGENTLVKN